MNLNDAAILAVFLHLCEVHVEILDEYPGASDSDEVARETVDELWAALRPDWARLDPWRPMVAGFGGAP